MKTTLIIPTLNEIEGVKVIMPQIKPEWYDQLIVIDGGSTDGTVEYLRDQGYQVIVQSRPGMRWAYMEVLPHVEGDVIVTFSPDGNSISELIPDLIDKMREGNDMVIVSRYLGDAVSYDDNFLTRMANWTYNILINTLFGGRYTDCMVIFRAYRTDLIRTLELDVDDGYRLAEKICRFTMSWEPLLSIRVAKRKLKLAEIPGDEPVRIGGDQRVHWRWGFGYLIQIAREVFVWR